VSAPTTAQTNKAGRILRKALSGEGSYSQDEIDAAWAIFLAFRAAHQYSLTKALNGVRSMVGTEGCKAQVSSRLKRAGTMLDKLTTRETTMQLANMEDVGGCRAILSNLDELRRVERRIKKNRPPSRVRDYIVNPRSSGYRAVHLIVSYGDRDGIDRSIEIQLRTPVMHEWAIVVERLSGRMDVDLKSGRGPEPVLDLLEAISEATALEERGEPVDDELLERMTRLRGVALPLMGGGAQR